MDHRIGSRTGIGSGGRGGSGSRVVVVVEWGGEGDCCRGCLRQRASHRRVVHSRRDDDWEARESLVAGRRQNGRAKLRSQAAKRQAGQKGQERPRWLRGAARSPYQAASLSRAREKEAKGQKRSMCAQRTLPMWIQILPSSSGWPAQPSAWLRAACDALEEARHHVLF